MQADPVFIARVQVVTDDPRMGVKVTAAQVGIDRVTLWRFLSQGRASRRTMRLLEAFATSATFKRIEERKSLCMV